MKIITPNYYNNFKCIANKCKHDCCTGWDIEIDKDSLKRYSSMTGKIKDSIYFEDGCAYFKAKNDGKCPFFNKDGLCDIILEHGEGALCQICADHPRFKNFYSDFIEMGIGLCCEEAARIILSQTEQFCIETPKTSDITIQSFLKLRQTVFDILQDREFLFNERLENLKDFFGIHYKIDWKNFFKELEVLDCDWPSEIEKMTDKPLDTKWDTVFEQLACYFIFRHLPYAIDDGLYIERIGFCIISCKAIGMICSGYDDLTFEKITDICRAFSSEIEYSDENPQKIFNIIK